MSSSYRILEIDPGDFIVQERARFLWWRYWTTFRTNDNAHPEWNPYSLEEASEVLAVIRASENFIPRVVQPVAFAFKEGE